MQTEEMFDDRYRIIQKLGAGSEGSVFLTLYTPTEEFRAVKKIKTGEGESSCRELEMMKRLHNVHLPRIIDVAAKGPYTYLVMEHVRGTGMDEILDGQRSVPAGQAEDAALQITDALCYLESRDPPVCHLDIKPSNLIRRPDGIIKLVDFGAAWKENMSCRGLGTEGYAAPEQYEAHARMDVRSDIYGLGAVLYRMLAGRRYSKVMYRSQIPNCPEDLGRIIRRCLEPDPDDRFQSAGELRRELLRIRKKEKNRQLRIRILGALAIAFPAAAFGASALPASMDLTSDREWDYESLLQEARVCSAPDSRACYRKAVFMAPARPEAYLQYLEDAGADGEFHALEDLFLRELFHTVEPGMDRTNEEELRTDPDAYGQVALQTGLLYWYCSEEEDGKYIASGWFDKARKEGECLDAVKRGSCLWLNRACLYEKLSSALRLAGKGDVRGPDPENAKLYWDIQTELMDQAKDLGSGILETQFYRDSISELSFLCADLELAGIGIDSQTERINELLSRAYEVTGTQAQAELIRVLQWEAEAAAVTAAETAENREREARKREAYG